MLKSKYVFLENMTDDFLESYVDNMIWLMYIMYVNTT